MKRVSKGFVNNLILFATGESCPPIGVMLCDVTSYSSGWLSPCAHAQQRELEYGLKLTLSTVLSSFECSLINGCVFVMYDNLKYIVEVVFLLLQYAKYSIQ